MAFAETARLAAELDLKGNFAANLSKATAGLNKFDSRFAAVGARAGLAGRQIGTGIANGVRIATVGITAVVGLLAVAAKEGQQAAKVQEIYAKAVSNSGRVSAAQVAILNAQQKALEDLAGVDDELIKTEQTRLIQMKLTGEQVAALTPLILDVAKATGKDLLTVTTAVGKAANGQTTALARLGIVLPKTKDATKAYAITVDELNKRFGGTTKALSGDLDTRLAALRQHLADVREEAGIKLLPALTRIVDVVGRHLVPALGTLIDAVLPSAIKGLDKLASFLEGGGAGRAIDSAMASVKPILATIKDILPALESGARITGDVIKTAVGLFRSLPPEIQALAVAGLAVNKLTGGLVTNIAGGLISAVLKQLVSGVVNVNGAVVNVNGLPGGLGGAAGGGGGILAALGGSAGLATIAAVVVPFAIGAAAAAIITDATNKDPVLTATRDRHDAAVAAGGQVGGRGGLRPDQVLAAAAKASAATRTDAQRAMTDLERAADTLTAAGHDQSEAARFFHATASQAAKQTLKGIETAILGQKRKGDTLKGQEFHVPQRIFIETHTSSKALKIADIYTGRFATETGHYYRSAEKAHNALVALKGLQQRELADGNTKAAARVGRNIDKMREILKTAVHGTTKAVDRKKLNVTNNVKVGVNVTAKSYFNSRTFQANFERFISFKQTHGGSV